MSFGPCSSPLKTLRRPIYITITARGQQSLRPFFALCCFVPLADMTESSSGELRVLSGRGRLALSRRSVHRPDDDPAALVLEAWSQGLMTGSLVIMAAVTFANMRPGVLLHKLILLEVARRDISTDTTC